MVELVTGDLFEADAEALVNPVNTRGVMGKGLALAFKRAFPANEPRHRERPRRSPPRAWRARVASVAVPVRALVFEPG